MSDNYLHAVDRQLSDQTVQLQISLITSLSGAHLKALVHLIFGVGETIR